MHIKRTYLSEKLQYKCDYKIICNHKRILLAGENYPSLLLPYSSSYPNRSKYINIPGLILLKHP